MGTRPPPPACPTQKMLDVPVGQSAGISTSIW